MRCGFKKNIGAVRCELVLWDGYYVVYNLLVKICAVWCAIKLKYPGEVRCCAVVKIYIGAMRYGG